MSKVLLGVVGAVVLAASAIVPGASAAPQVPSGAPAIAAPVAAKEFRNCTALNKRYPHGVGRSKSVRDSTSGTPVTNFKVSRSLYKANKKSDRDGDGIACEKR